MKELTDEQKTSFFTRLGELLGISQTEIKLSDYTAKDGSKISVNDDTLTVEGDIKDGEYELEDGRILAIKDSKLDTIKDAPAAPESETKAELAPAAEHEALKAENETLKAKVAELEKELETAKTGSQELQTKLSAIETAPADKKASLSATQNTDTKSQAQMAWERYNRK